VVIDVCRASLLPVRNGLLIRGTLPVPVPVPVPRCGAKRARAAVEDRVLAITVPAGSRFKGYQSFFVRDLELRPLVIRFGRERRTTPDGRTVVWRRSRKGAMAILARRSAVLCWRSVMMAKLPCRGWWLCSARSASA
jgi:hypothetical protein